MTEKVSQGGKWSGVLFIALFSLAAFYVADLRIVKALAISPLIVGIVLGMVYANSLRVHLPGAWVPGINFCTKTLLRWGIILYGFRLTFSEVLAVGFSGLVVDIIIIVVTLLLGVYVGRLLKMDKDLALLTSMGSAICGAAAVLGTEPVLKNPSYKSAIAVATVVIFGTIAMFIYPVFYRLGVYALTPQEMGIYAGATLHEVAHAVGAGNSMGPDVANTAVIVKMLRVILLAPVLLLMAVIIPKVRIKPEDRNKKSTEKEKTKISIPWFAFGFLVVIGINSLDVLKNWEVEALTNIDTFFLTMAMTALGVETSFDKFKKAGPKPFILALVLFVWLMGGGYLLSKYLPPMFG
ncbi:MAG: YeiH family protein [Bacteroidales bacterium]